MFCSVVTPTFTTPPPPTKTINEGQDLTLDCAASGPPTPNITWVQILANGSTVVKKEGKGSSALIIPKIQRPGGSSANFIYECKATNNRNQDAVTKRTEVTVHCEYKPVVYCLIVC